MITVGDTYKNKNGVYEVLNIYKDVKSNSKKMWIRFLDTGYERETFISNKDTVQDLSLPDRRIGTVIECSKFGKAIIIDVDIKFQASKNRSKIKVKFLETGYETWTETDLFKKNKCRDYLLPNVQGVGILGYVENISGRLRDMKEYRIWEGIIGRCYGVQDYTKKNTSYEFAEVEDRWKRFDYFLEDIIHINGYDMWKRFHEEYPNTKNIFEFDKDILVKGNKLYSRNTCMFVPKFINAGYTIWAFDETKQNLIKELEGLNYESIIDEARTRELI